MVKNNFSGRGECPAVEWEGDGNEIHQGGALTWAF